MLFPSAVSNPNTNFIPDAITKQAVNPESSRAAGKAFGNFQAMLADIPVQLGETIKDFHNMEFRLQQLREVVKADPVGRVGEPQVQNMLKEIENLKSERYRSVMEFINPQELSDMERQADSVHTALSGLMEQIRQVQS